MSYQCPTIPGFGSLGKFRSEAQHPAGVVAFSGFFVRFAAESFVTIWKEEELNAALAAAGLQHVGQFSSSQMALFCSSLARLPSTGRAAFLGVAALQDGACNKMLVTS